MNERGSSPEKGSDPKGFTAGTEQEAEGLTAETDPESEGSPALEQIRHQKGSPVLEQSGHQKGSPALEQGRHQRGSPAEPCMKHMVEKADPSQEQRGSKAEQSRLLPESTGRRSRA